jgi:hypothetical protein
MSLSASANAFPGLLHLFEGDRTPVVQIQPVNHSDDFIHSQIHKKTGLYTIIKVD